MAILKRVRKAIPKDLKCACSPRPWHGYFSLHSKKENLKSVAGLILIDFQIEKKIEKLHFIIIAKRKFFIKLFKMREARDFNLVLFCHR